MKSNIKQKIKTLPVKGLIAAMSLLPIAKSSAKTNYQLKPDNKYSLVIKGGPTFVLPSYIIDNNIKGSDMSGYNGGGFVEIGAARWLGGQGYTGKADFLIDFTGRIDVMHMNSRAAAVYEQRNVYNDPYHFASDVNPKNRNDLIATLNVSTGFGGHGVTVGANGGFGWHFDNGGNFGPVCVFGTGLGVRLNDHIQLNANYRFLFFPYENLGSETFKPTTVRLRNLVELGFVYKIQPVEKSR